MNKQYLLMVTIFTLASMQLNAKTVITQRSVASSCVIVGGKEFEHTKKSENGVNSEQFFIKGVPVEKEQYYEQLHAARVLQMHHEQQEAERKEHERDAMRDNVQRALLEKLVSTSIQDLSKDIQILEKAVIRPYLVFDASGLRSEQDLEQIQMWVDQISKNMKSSMVQIDVAALHKMVDDLQSQLELIQACLKKSTEKAIAQCDDSQVLKQLLELIEA